MKKLLTKLFLFLIITSLGFIISTSDVSAYTLLKSVHTTVDVVSEEEVMVTQSHTLTWDNYASFFPKEQNYVYAYITPAFKNQVDALPNSIKDLTVVGGTRFTEKIPFTQSIENGAIQLKIPYYDDLRNDTPLTFVVSYKTDLYIDLAGGMLDLQLPGLSQDFKSRVSHNTEGYTEMTNITISVSIPSRFGAVSSYFPTTARQAIDKKGNTTLQFSLLDLIGKSIQISVGNERLIKFELKGKTYQTNNDTPEILEGLLKNYIEVVLPSSREGTENGNQEILYSKIEPFPISLRTDSDGNVIARLPVSAASSGVIMIEGYAKLKNIPLTKDALNAVKTAISEDMKIYTAGEPAYWQTLDPSIVAVAQKEIDSSGKIMNQVRKTMAFVSRSLSYADIKEASSLVRLGAKESLVQKVGVCMEYSDLLLTLLRSQGIPTRAVFGDGVGTRVDRTLEGIGHQWVSVWLPGVGWTPIDPTWSDNNREYVGHDVNHFTWYVASASVNEPNGFNCLSWDATSPCKDALEISTTPVDSIPDDESLLTLSQIEAKISVEPPQPGWRVALQRFVDYLGESQLGRILLSKQGLLMLFGLFTYLILVSIISAVSKRIRKKKLQNAASQFPPTV